jgi:hypothetical protein
MVQVFAIKRWDNRKGDYEVSPYKYTAERIKEIAQEDAGRPPVIIHGMDEEVDETELDGFGRFDPDKQVS